MKIVGITGPSGSGKSLLGEQIKKAGIPCIDADELYHSLLFPPSRCLDAIAKRFGSEFICEDGSLNRALLSSKVFSDPSELKKLNDTVLPIVLDSIRENIARLEEAGETVVAVDAPTLIESGFHRECDYTVVVLAPANQRIIRASERDGISEKKAKERIAAQSPDDFYTAAADFVMVNDSDTDSFIKKADILIDKLKNL